MPNKKSQHLLPANTRRGLHARRSPPSPATTSRSIPQGVRIADVLNSDLTQVPPDGLPNLTPLQSAYVKRRLTHPLESKEETYRQIGSSPGHDALQRAPKVNQYFEAIAAHKQEGDQNPADLRREAIRALAHVIRNGDGREVPMAAKVLQDYLPRSAGQGEQRIAEMSSEDVMSRLEEVLSALGGQGLRLLEALRLPERREYGRSTVPRQGTAPPPPASGLVIDIEESTPRDGKLRDTRKKKGRAHPGS